MPDKEPTPKILLCPGQGAQHVGMGKAWADQCPIAAETFHEADSALDIELSKTCFEGSDEKIQRTDFAQAGLYTTAVACFRALKDKGVIDVFQAVAGLSLGEFTALHLAGVFDFNTGLQLVWLRGLAMQEAAEASDSGMVALAGADEQSARTLCRQVLEDLGPDGEPVLVPANFNCPGQVVISGSRVACECAISMAPEIELKAKALNVAGAFHSPLMKPAARRLEDALDEADIKVPLVPVLSNVTGGPHDADIGSIKRRLVEQLTSPVRWEQDVRWLLENHAGEMIELAPGKVLSGLMRRIDRKTRVTNFAEPPAPAVPVP